MQEQKSESNDGKSYKFVEQILKRMENDSSVGAALRRADNPSTEYQSWEYLANWCDLDRPSERVCYATIAAGLAKRKKSISAPFNLGSVIANCYPGGNEEDSAKRKLRRLLACETRSEACKWVRQILSLAKSKGIEINFSLLLDDLLYFGHKIKERWAMDFYGKNREVENDSINA